MAMVFVGAVRGPDAAGHRGTSKAAFKNVLAGAPIGMKQ